MRIKEAYKDLKEIPKRIHQTLMLAMTALFVAFVALLMGAR
jgi:hypothetical protein